LFGADRRYHGAADADHAAACDSLSGLPLIRAAESETAMTTTPKTDLHALEALRDRFAEWGRDHPGLHFIIADCLTCRVVEYPCGASWRPSQLTADDLPDVWVLRPHQARTLFAPAGYPMRTGLLYSTIRNARLGHTLDGCGDFATLSVQACNALQIGGQGPKGIGRWMAEVHRLAASAPAESPLQVERIALGDAEAIGVDDTAYPWLWPPANRIIEGGARRAPELDPPNAALSILIPDIAAASVAALELLIGEGEPTASEPTEPEAEPEKAKGPKPAELRAAASHEYAMTERPDLVPEGQTYSPELYDWLKEHGCDAYQDEDGQPIPMPSFEAWKRQVRAGRAEPGEPKAEPRAGRTHGGSIAHESEI